jgi:predicted dienelactone hydrolase
MPAGGIQAFEATVDFDPDNRGVSWSLTLAGGTACSPACGSLSEVDPLHATFTAPPAVSAKSTVTLTATSITDATRAASASITLSTGSVQLVPANLPFADTKARANGQWKKTLLTTLTNAGNVALDMIGVRVEGPNPQHFSANSQCGSRVGAGGSCNINVTFAPRSVGIFRADLVIEDSSSDSPQHIPLSGQGCLTLRPCAPFTVIQSVLANTAALAAPAPTGPNRVGTRTIDLVDPTRDDPYLANGTKRELLVRFWYPASVKRGCRPAPYAAPAVWDYLSSLAGVRAPTVRTNSCVNAQILDGAYPVIVFTHGYTGMLTDYTFLFEDLASRGYVVASIGHTYESTAVSFPDGRFVRSVLGSLLTTAPIDEQTIYLAESARLDDVSFVLDELTRLNNRPGSSLAGHLDTASIAIAGHSLGGLTALQAIAREPRIRAAVVLDGVAIDGDTGLTDTPVLILDAGRERWSVDQQKLWDKLRGPRFAINLKDAAHAAPSDLVWIAKGAVATGSMTSEQAVAATRDYVAAFLDASLQGKPVDPLLLRPSKRHPHVDVNGPNP